MNTTMKHAEELRVSDDRFVCWKPSRSMRFERRD